MRERRGSREGGGVRRAELDETVSAMKRGNIFGEVHFRGLLSAPLRLRRLSRLAGEGTCVALGGNF